MTRGDLGPPGRERPGATASTGPIQKSADSTTDKTKITASHSTQAGYGGVRRRCGYRRSAGAGAYVIQTSTGIAAVRGR